jgi:cellulose synthase/poly-beta-1,6-N-acetylglucosamine synthase-like glycosyltransferase
MFFLVAANELYELYAGHRNVLYVGDRQRLPNQLNGKSANLNHVMTQKIYPGITSWEDIPEKDVVMVVDCDHMCKPELFDKMGPCMRDTAVAVTLVPQWFHNLVHPGPTSPSYHPN